MARSVNKVQLIGTLGKDPEARQLNNGAMVVSMSLATDESYNDKQTGQKIERCEWHRVTAFGKLAEICEQYLRKGQRVYFEGKLKTDEYIDRDGNKRYSTGIIADDMMMLERKDQGQQQQPQQNYGYAQQQPVQQPAYQTQQNAMYAQQQQPQQNHQQQLQQPAYQQPVAHQTQQVAPPNQFGEFNDDIPF